MIVSWRPPPARRYLGPHPGGSAVIERLAGSDATNAYRAAGHSRAADLKLFDFDVGAISDVPRLRRAAHEAAQHRARLGELAQYLDDGR